jgi:hypothetical protein
MSLPKAAVQVQNGSALAAETNFWQLTMFCYFDLLPIIQGDFPLLVKPSPT